MATARVVLAAQLPVPSPRNDAEIAGVITGRRAGNENARNVEPLRAFRGVGAAGFEAARKAARNRSSPLARVTIHPHPAAPAGDVSEPNRSTCAKCDPARSSITVDDPLPSGALAFAAAAALEAARALLGDDPARARVLLADALRALEAAAPRILHGIGGDDT